MYKFFVGICRAVVCVSVSVGALFSFTPSNKEIAELKKKPLSLPENFTVTAHSGAMSTLDNTLPSVKQIVASDVDIIEVDVTFRPDGTPVIIHEEAPTQKQGALLSEALAIIHAHGSMRINLDLKAFWNLPALQKMIIEQDMLDRVFFTGVEEKTAETVKKDCPLIPFYLNHQADEGAGEREIITAAADRITELGAVGINLSFKNITPLLCEIMHEKGLLVSAYTANKTLDQHRLLALGVDNITTRKPIKLMKLIENWQNSINYYSAPKQ